MGMDLREVPYVGAIEKNIAKNQIFTQKDELQVLELIELNSLQNATAFSESLING